VKVFFITDNRKWFEKVDLWKKERSEEIEVYCSPAGVALFSNEIGEGCISALDLNLLSDDFSENFDIGISCHCKQIFPSKLVENIKCFNFHPGLNPHNRGWFPQVFSILDGQPVGATLHKMDEKIDHGPIIDQRIINITDWDTSKSVYERILKSEFDLFDQWIDRLLKGEFEEVRLESEGNYNSISDFKKLCEIDLDKKISFKEAIDYLRAMTFDGYDNAYFYSSDGRKVYVSLNIKA
jgi:methionyl-tRNA formyltransferase